MIRTVLLITGSSRNIE